MAVGKGSLQRLSRAAKEDVQEQEAAVKTGIGEPQSSEPAVTAAETKKETSAQAAQPEKMAVSKKEPDAGKKQTAKKESQTAEKKTSASSGRRGRPKKAAEAAKGQKPAAAETAEPKKSRLVKISGRKQSAEAPKTFRPADAPEQKTAQQEQPKQQTSEMPGVTSRITCKFPDHLL